MSAIFLFLVFVFVILPLGIMGMLVHKAKDGWEDNDEFHEGKEPKESKESNGL